MRYRSAANSAASSPPVPGRISTMAGRSFSGSGGTSSGLSLRSTRPWACSDALHLCARLGGHFCVVNDNELARLRELVIEFFQPLGQRDDVGEPLVLTSERCEQAVHRGRSSDRASSRSTSAARSSASARRSRRLRSSVPYFCRKRSTRPAVSISFCFPVKNGWQTLQMSRMDLSDRGTRLERIAAGALHGRGRVLGMDIGFHVEHLSSFGR